MAKTETKDKISQEGGTGTVRKVSGGFLIMAALVLVCVFFTHTVLLVGVGLIPTFVAFIIDRSPQKYATLCVGGLNISGVFPYLLDLWIGSNDMTMARAIVTDPYSLMIMYATAGFGWMLYLALPPVLASILMILAQKKVAQLRTQQREILEEWGDGIVTLAHQDGGHDAPPHEPDRHG
ncbi:MAG: hypothetical protein KDE22_17010 [Rhodobacterales bacterium]|nr:hypothetical protein [Rhodobacterales bacterium]